MSYLPEWMTIAWQALLAAGGALAVIGGAIATIWAKVIKPGRVHLSRAKTFVARVNVVLDDHPTMVGAIADIRREIKSNGGMSLKDAVNRTEAKIDVLEARQKARFEAETDIAFFTDVKGEVEAVSGGYTDLTGLDTHRAKREGWREVIHPDDVERVASAWHAAVAGQTIFACEFRYVHLVHGGSVPCRVTATPVMRGDLVTGWSGNVKRLAPLQFAPDPEAISAVNEIFEAHARERSRGKP